MPIAYWCVLMAALLPLCVAGYAKSGSRDNNAPRDAKILSKPFHLKDLVGEVQRLLAA